MVNNNKKKAPGYNWNTGGYNGMTNTQLQQIALPEMLKCEFCKKKKPHQMFSKAQHAKVREAIHRNGQNAVLPDVRCIPCSGGQILEMHCQSCDAWKGNSQFSKAQRKTPDNAMCLVCMAEHLDFEPAHIEKEVVKPATTSDSDSSDVYSSEDEDDYASSGDERSTVTATNGPLGSSLTGSMATMSVGNTTTGSVGSSQVAASYFSITTDRSTSGGVPLANGSRASATANYQYGQPRSRVTANSTDAGTENDNRKFAKVKAHRPAKSAHAYQEDASKSDEDVVYDSPSDDDDDDDE